MLQNPDTLPGTWPGLQGGNVVVATTLPLQVPIVQPASGSDGSTVGQVSSPGSNTSVVQPIFSTPTTSFSGLLTGKIGAILSDPTNHLIGLTILLLVAWWIWKHVIH